MALAASAWLLALSGCSDLAYYGQAVSGQLYLLGQRRPVDQLILDPDISTPLREHLQNASAMRAFAISALALPDNGSYRTYADLQRPYVVWNVFAAPELSLKLKEWCFLVVGCVSYRGYFDEIDARVLAAKLSKRGYDVYVAGIPAYSTLGWFDDPLLSTFVSWPSGRLAELVFHELAHQRLFIDGDTAFNESFATAVGRLGARQWLAQHGSAEDALAYQAFTRRREDFLALVLESREALVELYESDESDAAKGVAKQELLAHMRRRYERLKRDRWQTFDGYDAWFYRDLNNAKLAGLGAYTRFVPAFEVLFELSGQDFEAFYQAVAELGERSRAAREARLRQLMDATPKAQRREALRKSL